MKTTPRNPTQNKFLIRRSLQQVKLLTSQSYGTEGVYIYIRIYDSIWFHQTCEVMAPFEDTLCRGKENIICFSFVEPLTHDSPHMLERSGFPSILRSFSTRCKLRRGYRSQGQALSWIITISHLEQPGHSPVPSTRQQPQIRNVPKSLQNFKRVILAKIEHLRYR